MNSKKKACLLGLDGFNRELYEFLLARGLVPGLTGLVAEGASGVLRSTRPPYTGPAWVSMMTGLDPGEHGIFGFTRRRDNGREELLTSASISAPRLWDCLGGAGFRTGVFNVPFTYPASEVNGFMVSGMLAPSLNSDFARPRPLAEEIRSRRPGYIFDVTIDPERDWRRPGALRALRKEAREKIELLEELLARHDPDFLGAVFTAPDRLQHLWGKALRPGGEALPEWAEEALGEIFALLDGLVRRLREWVGPGGLFLVASDHGFAGMEGTFYLNNWLVREGFLRLKSSAGRFPRLLGRLNRPGLKRLLPRRLMGRLRSRGLAEMIAWEETAAVASPGMEEGIYLNHAPGAPEGETRVRAEAIRKGLLELRVPRLRDVLRRESVYSGSCVSLAPDLLLDFAFPGWNMSGSLTGSQLVRSWEGLPYGTHHPDGFWAASGPGTIPGPRPAAIPDIAPTVLAFFGLDPLPGMEGRSLLESIPGGIVPVSLPPRAAAASPGYTQNEEARLRERLAGLGYL